MRLPHATAGLATALLLGVVGANTTIITTFAGSLGGFSGDEGPATSARMQRPFGVALDGGGNLLIADSYNNRIRRVDAGTGIITTVAGNGSWGFSGDGGPATSARLFVPQDIAVDSGGDMFIADSNTNRVRRVAAGTGVITTVAGNGSTGFSGDGGPATSARLTFPSGVAVDTVGGHLLISDSSNNRIRRVDAGTGVITTVAGTGVAGFSGDEGPGTSARVQYPQGIAVDADGHLFIADHTNCRIRRVAAGTGVITTVAGNGMQGFSGDGGPATSAQLAFPNGVAVDNVGGHLFIADYSNHRIRRVAAGTGVITTVAGTGVSGFSGNGGPGTSAGLSFPSGAVVAGGNLLIADTYNNRIRRLEYLSATATSTGSPRATPSSSPARTGSSSSTGSQSATPSSSSSGTAASTGTGSSSSTGTGSSSSSGTAASTGTGSSSSTGTGSSSSSGTAASTGTGSSSSTGTASSSSTDTGSQTATPSPSATRSDSAGATPSTSATDTRSSGRTRSKAPASRSRTRSRTKRRGQTTPSATVTTTPRPSKSNGHKGGCGYGGPCATNSPSKSFNRHALSRSRTKKPKLAL